MKIYKKLLKIGGSNGIIIDSHILKQLNLKRGDYISLDIANPENRVKDKSVADKSKSVVKTLSNYSEDEQIIINYLKDKPKDLELFEAGMLSKENILEKAKSV